MYRQGFWGVVGCRAENLRQLYEQLDRNAGWTPPNDGHSRIYVQGEDRRFAGESVRAHLGMDGGAAVEFEQHPPPPPLVCFW
jgi:hypothetical protein